MEAEGRILVCGWQPGGKQRVKMAERAEHQALEVAEETLPRVCQALGGLLQPRKSLGYLKPSLGDSFQL